MIDMQMMYDLRVKNWGMTLVCCEEQVAMFLHILAHHSKNRVIKFLFKRSGETVSRYFNLVLNGVLRLHETLLKAPEPVPEDCVDERWKFFKVLFILISYEIFICVIFFSIIHSICNYRSVLGHWMEHISKSMYQRLTSLDIVIEKGIYLPIFWVLVLGICNLFMCCLDG